MVELLTAVAAVIGALAGLVNSWQIARLTGRVDSIEQTQHHVLGALMHGETGLTIRADTVEQR